ncbi:energy transducer TonB [Parvularcula sp. LCG005]|uniref:energy transducer TonB n=1 Tax=Parvularcula sp. LCG005 TaxID=3078805 RepID=UPI002942286C|nr:energy transducer TonB [Parvularcula sp. LCG005]WOI52148.1 energy transducer TonB [Parvularcula sp. LCG005]
MIATTWLFASILVVAGIGVTEKAPRCAYSSAPPIINSEPLPEGDHDAIPVLMCAPPERGPSGTQTCKKGQASVTMTYDILADGTTDNVIVIETSDVCFNASAVAAILSWRYAPKTENGMAVIETGRKSTMNYNFSRSEYRRQ